MKQQLLLSTIATAELLPLRLPVRPCLDGLGGFAADGN